MTRYSFITYIKALCIMAVIFTHYNFTSFQRMHVIFPFLIETAVPFFMVISGFNYTNSYLRRGITTLSQMYNIKELLKRIERLVVIFIPFVLFQWFYIAPIKHYKHSFLHLFINGGFGPGSYYFPVMLQLIVLFPLIYMLIKKQGTKGLVFIFIVNFIFELIMALTDISNSTYRILFFRYLMFVGFGVWGFINKDTIKDNILNLSLITGIVYLAISTYTNSSYVYPFVHWTITSMFVSFYVFALFMYAYKHFKDKQISNTFLHNALTAIGNASWHIFLVQSTFFALYKKPLFILNHNIMTIILNISFDIAICIILGVIIYFIEKKIRLLFKRKEA